ncbi:uncharacterized protein LACBIDRAFT_310448 [Laccaria bicolor S238N-H82]|uniref:Predicted protein n=1 Tax=Laccaria bicolor (strain S238N-H82 / ATCC MYA-4686) TaxID=486041 RepID=B0DUD1_LACBS|nr:uncharacterized protein LACBIDRAFT_310448 [Laccaria bicolor S238N-H82]EDR01721.1 predicted protein [Laccaria bicolor S238N-H82]|eukprot:XP_001887534.1 predicted protein [Laccaria bicolor S238N-H82]
MWCVQILRHFPDGDFFSGRGYIFQLGGHILSCIPGTGVTQVWKVAPSFTGAWAGRCVIAHLDDCWGPFRRSLASSDRTWHR